METAATQVANTLVEPAKNLLFSAIGYVASCSDNLDTLEEQVEELQGKAEEVKKDLEDAERKDQSATEEVRLWLKRVEKLQDEPTKMKTKFESMCTCIGSCGPNVVSRYRLSTRAEELKRLAEDLCKNIPPVSRTSDPNQFVERLCAPLVGRGSVLEKLQGLALDHNKSIIGIYGMAGVGKTELLNKFYMDFHQNNHDYRMIWVDMKDRHSVEDTQKAITERLELHWDEKDKQEVRANRILRNLNKKSFVLILDDMWSEVNLKDVGIPIATQQAKSKVILATRRGDICDAMEAEKIQIKCLDWMEAWSLFVEKAGKDMIESAPETLHQAEIQHQAEILVKKCGGLPLALVTIGRAMARKWTLDLWKHAVTTLENTPQQIRGMKDVLSCLKLSYDNLPDDKSRIGLLYCALFPEDYDIYKRTIVEYCIGEGVLVDRFYEGDHIYNEGYNLLDVLKSASMLEPISSDPYHIKMHPMIRVLALWMESGTGATKCLIRAGKRLVEPPDVDDWDGIERISLMNNNIETLSEKPNSPSLLTLLLNNNPLHKICDGFFQSMTKLRVLDLSHSYIREVPPEIGDLVQLQYLDLSSTMITSLPQTLGNLVRLRYFLLSYTRNLKSIPDGLIKNLSKLRVLYMHGGYDKWKLDSDGEGVNIEELHMLKRLKTVGISVNTVSVLRKLAGSNRLANCTRHLKIKYCPGLKNTLSTATVGSNFKALKNLYISRCGDLKELSIDADHGHEGSSSLPNLVFLSLNALPRAVLTWNGGRLQNLMKLRIIDCAGIRQLIHCDFGCTDEEDEGEELEGDRLRKINVLPNLYQLELIDLPELESLSCGSRPLAFPSLEILDVDECPKLKKLPLHAEKLRRISGESSWWNGLDWTEDHDNIKSKFQSIFKEISEPNSQEERPDAAGLGAEDPLYEKLQQLAIDDGVNIIGVHGMAGVGKTRLLDNFFYQFHLRDYYRMIRIDMDASHNVEDTQKAVAGKLGVFGHQDKSHEELARIISGILNQINFVLILDNVWRVVDLNAIGIPTTTCQAKHKIILATRNEDICDGMEATKLHVKCLEWNEAWSLFVEKAGQKLIHSHPMILWPAITLVKKCGGLPLALVTIGRAMSKKRNHEMWEHAVKALENNPQQIRGMKDVFSCLKLSFDHVVDDNLRKCLLYCFQFWEDGEISKQAVIEYCVGEGVLDGIDWQNEGDKLLGVLKAKSLLEDGSNSEFVKVHPMIRNFALWTAGDSWLMRAKKELTEIPDAAEWRGAERISLFGNNIKALSGRPNSPVLLTLLLQYNPVEKICSGFFQYMKNLRVLDLSYTHIQEVPAEIGELIELQYLNLSGTGISSLPKELGNLNRLRSLGLSFAPSLKKIPEGLFARLTDLRALGMVCSYSGWKVGSDGDGVGFEELQCLKLLKALWISVNTAITLQKLATSPLPANCTLLLEITLSQGLTTLSTAAIGSEFKALKSLQLRQCSDLEELAIDNGNCEGLSTLPHLKGIALIELPRAKITWSSGRLQSLVSLQISCCGGIRQLIHCDDESIKEKEVEKKVLEEINILPNLQQLSLVYLTELESLSCGSKPLAFPSLQVLDVADCPKLKKLPTNAEKLQRINGQKSWWNGLEWPEDDNIKSKYESIFVEAYL